MQHTPRQKTGQGNAPVVKYSTQYNFNVIMISNDGVEEVCPLIMEHVGEAVEAAFCFFPDAKLRSMTSRKTGKRFIHVFVDGEVVATITEREVR